MALPAWAFLAGTLGPALLSMLFGGKSDNTTTQETITETPKTGYQSPTLGILDPLMGQMLLKNVSRLGGAGFPAGAGNMLGGDIAQQIMQLLGGEAAGLAKKYGQTEPGRWRR